MLLSLRDEERAQAVARVLTLHRGLVKENANIRPELEKQTGTLEEDGELTPRDARTQGMQRKEKLLHDPTYMQEEPGDGILSGQPLQPMESEAQFVGGQLVLHPPLNFL